MTKQTAAYQNYDLYKDSGLDWMGKIPSGWKLKPLKYLFAIQDTRLKHDPSADTLLSVSGYDGIVPKNLDVYEGQMPSEDVSEYRIVRKNNLVVNTMWLNYTGLGVSNHEGYVSPAYRAYEIGSEIYPRFAHYLLRSPLYVQKYSSLLYGVRPNSLQVKPYDFDRIEVLIPTKDDQIAISNFLDTKLSIVDFSIEKKKKLIELLQEKRHALIALAVTKGLDPDVKMKDSGVEWIGEIPMKWAVLKIKHLVMLKSGSSITSEQIEDTGDYAVYGGNGIRGYYSEFTHKGDYVLIGRQGALCGNINFATGRFWASEHAVVANPVNKFSIVWFGEMLRVMNLNQYSISAAQPGISLEKISNLHIPVPPYEEQKIISVKLRNLIHSSDLIIEKMKNQISVLAEYKSALIYNAIKGKIKV
jgi:type I restriction enzyme, S subunit